MSVEDRVRQLYPFALPQAEVVSRVLTAARDADRRPEQVLLAVSVCRDEVNDSWRRLGDGQLLPAFDLGGLAGLPFGGVTGLSAFAHHVPDEGLAVILYGPHLGLSDDGEAGRIRRPGRAHQGACCGALVGALGQGASPPTADDLDPEMVAVRQATVDFLAATEPDAADIQGLTDYLYERIDQQVQAMLERARPEFGATPILTIGGVVINTGPGEGDWFDWRDDRIHR